MANGNGSSKVGRKVCEVRHKIIIAGCLRFNSVDEEVCRTE